ncbi:MAG: bifunctional diaminohydroxyphosphoribosylaminopyrimidine deaminase/5-amino-6-(5-phosphoribosylamino)uracil reductase RibD [Flavobacteriaceae bacterium]|nr:bifunctional diaminohydroxyphosphoribosylaminopyrimidine deaminase/5-amino-6-(5-phosphoribosylamino)uracil reductase RibD [Flavobacteriaceae bacterium]MCY4268394.1 bifunctional diaminohydroxyphosphoribosylaminopyrimidine deaminase/5-amino-6-(5-phosphoribosylamino)uracil reductase RibD [Flavobacteriaceae bacterium]MCY4298369.1 bifunctional diaminohydroxyphosphoribosylaminopyrimidine deaminase/5-amino-6-(5-phosphoribosylamino)uracil reductase RibD [Flavobacteriaceae bacterium]
MDRYSLLMQRCLQLAEKGLGSTYPNPLVGALIVHHGQIIGQGYHYKSGLAHAEVKAIQSVKDSSKFKKSTLVVNLEPCNHFGKTPPCTHAIIKSGIKKVVIGTKDPYPQVNGQGIQMLRTHGIQVIHGVEKHFCQQKNKRFFCFIKNKRPYIILKWAQSLDGFIAPPLSNRLPKQPYWLTNSSSRKLVHQWRYQENAILVGAQTAIDDNPNLLARYWKKPPRKEIRVLVDPQLRVSKKTQLYDGNALTYVLTSKTLVQNSQNVEFIKLKNHYPISIDTLLHELYLKNIQSIIVEGGQKTLQYFLNSSLWDEARIFTSPHILNQGLKAPKLNESNNLTEIVNLKNDQLKIIHQLPI